MPEIVYDLDPVTFITVGTIGPPGQRTFFLQASQNDILVSLIIEKEQAQALSDSLSRLLDALDQRYPRPPEAVQEVDYNMSLIEPVHGLWRVGQMGLGYDEERDLIVLIAQQLLFDDDEQQEPELVRFTATREQMRALSEHAAWVVQQGRPQCPLCGQPIDATGHFCPPSNGHRRAIET